MSTLATASAASAAPAVSGGSTLVPVTGAGRFDAFAALCARIGAGFRLDGRWVVPVTGGPVAVIDTVPRTAAQVDELVAGAHGAVLVGFVAAAPVTVTTADDPLVTTDRFTALGAGGCTGMTFKVAAASPLPGVPLAVARTRAFVVRHDGVTVAPAEMLSDALIGAADNAVLAVAAFDADRRLVAAVRGFRRPAGAHPAPVVVDASSFPLPDGDPDDAATVRRTARMLPDEVADALMRFADDSDPSGALVVRGLPVGTLPLTPATPAVAPRLPGQELLLLAAGRVLGQPVGYRPEFGGRLVQHLVPVRESADRQVSTSSKVTLAWHTEAAFHRHRPRFLLLSCLRGDAAATTTFCSAGAVLPTLSVQTRATLAEPLFRTGIDESYRSVDGAVDGAAADGRLGGLLRVLSGSPDAPQLLFDADLMVGTTRHASDALVELSNALRAASGGVVLEPGDLLVVDNTVAVHGRSPYQPRFDGTDRWLLRTFVVADLASSAGERDGRVVTTRFS